MAAYEAARLGTSDDISAVVAIAARHRTTLPDARGGELLVRLDAARPDLADELTSALEADDRRIVVGTFDDVVFGYALARIVTLDDGGLLGVIDDFLVDEEARGVGIGAVVMNLMSDELRAAGCIGLDSRALPGDRETKNFFESFGLKARLLVVHHRFED